MLHLMAEKVKGASPELMMTQFTDSYLPPHTYLNNVLLDFW